MGQPELAGDIVVLAAQVGSATWEVAERTSTIVAVASVVEFAPSGDAGKKTAAAAGFGRSTEVAGVGDAWQVHVAHVQRESDRQYR